MNESTFLLGNTICKMLWSCSLGCAVHSVHDRYEPTTVSWVSRLSSQFAAAAAALASEASVRHRTGRRRRRRSHLTGGAASWRGKSSEAQTLIDPRLGRPRLWTTSSQGQKIKSYDGAQTSQHLNRNVLGKMTLKDKYFKSVPTHHIG